MSAREDADEVFERVGPAPGDDGRQAIVVRVQVSPGAGRSAVVGRHGDALKLRVAAPPTGGRANDAAAALLASTLGVRSDQVSLAGGATARSKRFRVDDVDVEDVRRLLAEAMTADASGAGNARGRRGVR